MTNKPKTIVLSCISDTHGKPPEPNKNADIVILAGDICNNYLENFTFVIKDGLSETVVDPKSIFWNFRRIDWEKEGAQQYEWLKNHGSKKIFQRGFKPEDVIWVNGNHDGIKQEDISKIFPNSVSDSSGVFTVKGVKIGVVAGVLPYCGEWWQEVADEIIDQRLKELPRDIDVLVTHSPPYNIRDLGYNDHIGSLAIYKSIFGFHSEDEPYFNKLQAHIFGHAHENNGKTKHKIGDREIVFVNASNSRYDIEINL